MKRRYHSRSTLTDDGAIMHSQTVLHGANGRRVVRNPEDGSYTCLEMVNRRWEARKFGATSDEAQEFMLERGS